MTMYIAGDTRAELVPGDASFFLSRLWLEDFPVSAEAFLDCRSHLSLSLSLGATPALRPALLTPQAFTGSF